MVTELAKKQQNVRNLLFVEHNLDRANLFKSSYCAHGYGWISNSAGLLLQCKLA